MKEKDIVFEGTKAWVAQMKKSYVVFRIGTVASTSDSAYSKTPEGLSLAIARAKYLDQRCERLNLC